MKYRLLVNSEGKYRVQYRRWFFHGWETLPYSTTKGGYASMDEAMERIADHEALLKASEWTSIDLPD